MTVKRFATASLSFLPFFFKHEAGIVTNLLEKNRDLAKFTLPAFSCGQKSKFVGLSPDWLTDFCCRDKLGSVFTLTLA